MDMKIYVREKGDSMSADYMDVLILYCLQKVEKQRTVYAVFHLLNGKKSAQTIQDAHLFKLAAFFKAFPKFSRQHFDERINKLERSGWLKIYNGQHRITEDGCQYMESELRSYPIPASLNGLFYHTQAELLWERLSLLVQVASNLNANHTKYLPIQRKKETHIWLKNFLMQSRMGRDQLTMQLYRELTDCFSRTTDIRPELLITRLSGFEQIGLTAVQTAEKFGMDSIYYRMHFLAILHFMLQTINSDQQRYILLSSMVEGEENLHSLTISANRTMQLLNQGWTIEEIANKRQLKSNTIEDHLVEIALNIDSFDINKFVKHSMQEEIRNAAEKVVSKQLKHIKQQVPNATYFEIRLVLAKLGEK